PGMDHKEILKDIEDIIQKLSSDIKDFKADVRVTNNRPAVETKADDPFVKLAIATIKEEFGREVEAKGVNFYTDASVFLPEKDLPCIFYGPGDSSMAHQPDEYVEIDSYLESIMFYCALIERYLVR